MSDSQIHKNDIGTVFTISITDSGTAVDLSTANTSTSRVLLFRSPDGSTTTQTASFSGSGTAGVLLFTLPSALLNTAGTWQMQAKITLGTTTAQFYSDVWKFDVYDNLE